MTLNDNRWYDTDPQISAAMRAFLSIPVDFQTLVADFVIHRAENELRDALARTGIRSMGADKIVRLNKSKRKLRNYDRNPMLHKAMNYLAATPESTAPMTRPQFVEVMAMVTDYMKVCKAYKVPVVPQEVKRMLNTYVTKGSDSAKHIVTAMEHKLAHLYDPNMPLPTQINASSMTVMSRHQELTGIFSDTIQPNE